MAHMLLVNPRKRRKTRGRKKASKRVRRSRARAPTRRRRSRKVVSRRRRNPIRMHRRRRRRNPLGLNFNSIKSQVMDSAIGAGGAVVLDIALGYLPVPASLKTGTAAPLVKGAAAIVMGMLASKVVGSGVAHKMAGGALTVMLHGIIKRTAGTMLPSVQMGAWDDDGLSYYGSGENPAQIGEFLSDSNYGDNDGDPMGEYLADTTSDGIY